MITYDIKFQSPFSPDQEVEQKVYFNLTRDELMRMLNTDPADNPIAKMGAASTMTGVELYGVMRELVLAAYGVPNASRTGLRKNPRLREDFEGSPLLDEVMDVVMASEEAAIRFFKGIIPPKMDVEKIIAQAQAKAQN